MFEFVFYMKHPKCVCDITHNLGYINFLTLLSNHNHWPLILGSPKFVSVPPER